MSFKRYLNILLFANVSNVLRIKLINLSTAEAVLRPPDNIIKIILILIPDQLVYCGSGIETASGAILRHLSYLDQLVYCGSGIETLASLFRHGRRSRSTCLLRKRY